jgi:hypothetical protein
MFEWFFGLLTAVVNFFMSFFGKSEKQVSFSEDTKPAEDEEVQLPLPSVTE